MRKLLFLSAIASLVLFACSQDAPPDITPPVVTDTTAMLPVAANVYIAGDTIDTTPWANNYAVY